MALSPASTAQGRGLNRAVLPYARQRWGEKQGFTGDEVTAFAQTTDGYLWIGTKKGLVRFDGLEFRVFPEAVPHIFQIGGVRALTTDSRGNLWILLEDSQILRFHNGRFESGREGAEFAVSAIGTRRDGTALFASLTGLGTLTFGGEKFEVLAPQANNLPTHDAMVAVQGDDDLFARFNWATGVAGDRVADSAVIAIAETSDGKIWLATRDHGFSYLFDGRVSRIGRGTIGGKTTGLLPLDNGEMWIGTDKGVLRWDGMKLTQVGVPAALRRADVHALLRGRDGNIWVGTAEGLIRANKDGLSYDAINPGETSAVSALFEDREGNVWVGRSGEIERLHDTLFLSYSEGDSGGPVYVDENGRTWFAPLEGSLHWREGTETGTTKNDSLSQDVVYSIAGQKHELWIGRQSGGLTRFAYDSKALVTRTYTESDGLAQNSVYAVYESHDGTVWAGTLSRGISKLKDGHFANYTATDGLASNTVSSIAEGADGSMWFGTAKGLSEFSQNRWRTYGIRDGLVSPDINCLLQDSSGVLWIGTAGGLAFLRNGRVQIPQGTQPWLTEPIFGMAEDGKEGLWIATSNLVLRAKRKSLISGQALNDSDSRLYGRDDGLLGTEGVRRFRSVVKDSRGNVWFSTNRGLSVVNVDHSQVDSLPALLHVEGVTMDGSEVKLGQPLRVPPGEHRLVFDYVGLSLANPQRVRYRYRLDGVDRGWSEATSNRQATFSNLGPGTYRFRVMSSNSDGIWNTEGAAIDFSVIPAFYQTAWFRALCSGALLGLLWLLYQLRVRQLHQKFALVVDARVNERTRIARELHDTMLQSFQGVLMKLHALTYVFPDLPEAQQTLEKVITEARQAITEGRDAVQGLRSSTLVTNDVAEALNLLGKELAAQSDGNLPEFSVDILGTPRDLVPLLRDEVYRITSEALRNAFRHARARRIEVEIRYDQRQLRLRVRDDGKGIDREVLEAGGRVGHYGFSSMRERANLIGGKLAVCSELDSGTETELTIPASIAYAKSEAGRRLMPRRKGA